MGDRPFVISPGTVSRTLAEAEFYDQVPEYRTLRPKLEAMRVEINKKGGCSGCRKRRVARNLYGDFIRVTQSLSDDGIRRLKAYLGVEKLLLNTTNPSTGATQVRVV